MVESPSPNNELDSPYGHSQDVLNHSHFERLIRTAIGFHALNMHEIAFRTFNQAFRLLDHSLNTSELSENELTEFGGYPRLYESYYEAQRLVDHQPDEPNYLYLKATYEFQLGQFDAARDSVKAAIALNAHEPNYWFLLGVTNVRLEDNLGALEALEQVTQFEVKAELIFHVARLYEEAGQKVLRPQVLSEKLISFYDRAIATQNEPYADAYFAKAEWLALYGDYSQAIAVLDALLAWDDTIAGAWLNKGLVLHEAGDLESALICFDKVLSLNPDFEVAWVNKIFVLRKLDRIEEALTFIDLKLTTHSRYHSLWFAKVDIYIKAKLYEQALVTIEEAKQHLSPSIQAITLTAEIHEHLKNVDEAINCYQQLSDYFPDEPQTYAKLGFLYLRKQELPTALDYFDKALKLNPTFEEALLGKAKVLDELEQYEEAIKTINKVLKLSPNSPQAWNNKGIYHQHNGEYLKAKACFEKVLSYSPAEVVVLTNLGKTYALMGDEEQALRYYEEANNLNPNYDEAWLKRGELLFERKQFSQALDCFDQVLTIKPQHFGALLNKAQTYYLMADYSQAISCFDVLIQAYPQNSHLYHDKGHIEKAAGLYTQALDSYEKSAQLDPRDPYNWQEIGSIYYQLGQAQTALFYYYKAFELDKTNISPLVQIIKLHLAAKDFQQAQLTFELATQINPSNVDPYFVFAEHYLSVGQFSKATSLFQKLAVLSPNDGVIQLYLGHCFYHQKQYSNALIHLEQAEHLLRPENRYSSYLLLGLTLYRLKSYQRAVGYFEQLVMAKMYEYDIWEPFGDCLHHLRVYDLAHSCYRIALANAHRRVGRFALYAKYGWNGFRLVLKRILG